MLFYAVFTAAAVASDPWMEAVGALTLPSPPFSVHLIYLQLVRDISDDSRERNRLCWALKGP